MAVAMNMPIKERFGVPVLDIVNALIEAAKLSRSLVGEDTLRLLLDVLVSLYNIYKSSDWSGVIINITNLFAKFLSTKHVEIALDWFKKTFTCFTQSDDGQGWKPMLDSFFDVVDRSLNDSLWKHIEQFIHKIILLYTSTKKLVSFESIDLPTVWKKFQDFRDMFPACQDIISCFFTGYEFITGNWQHIISGDWSKLALGKEQSKELEIEVRILETAYNYVIANQEIALKEHYNMTPDQYDTRLTKVLKKSENLLASCTSVQQRICISQFIKSLTEKQHNLWARKADAPTKEQAWAIKLSGPSNCGKSTMVNLLSKTILYAYNHDPKDNGLCVITNIEERYESSIKPSHKIIVADDVANNANSKPNYDRILNYVNTVPRALEKAGVAEKGNQYPGNDALIVTTNVESLRAEECSACPESILRRFNLDVEVHIKPEYATDYGGLKTQDDIRFDVYNLVLKRFSSFDAESGNILWSIIPRTAWNPDNNSDFPALCKFVAQDIAAHRVRQAKQSEMQTSLRECVFCEDCQVPKVVCTCCPIVAETQSLVTAWNEYSTAELWRTRRTLTSVKNLFTDCYKNTLFWKKIWSDRVMLANMFALFTTCSFVGLFVGKELMQFITITLMIFGFMYYKKLIIEIDQELQRRTDRLSSLCEDVRDHLRNNSIKYFAGGAIIFTLYGFYKILKPLIQTQDTTSFRDNMLSYWDKHLDSPKDDKCVVVTQDERNYKEGYSRLPPKMNHLQKTCPGPQLHESVMKSLRHVTVYSKGKKYCTTNGIMVHSNVILVPSHLLPDTFPICIETTTTPGVPSASTKDQKLTKEFVYIDREYDFALVHLPTSPASTSYLEHFADEYPDFLSRPTTLLWKSPQNKILRSDHLARVMQDDLPYRGSIETDGTFWGTAQTSKIYKIHKGKGLVADMQFNGFGGLCGGLWCDRTKGIIYGMHVAGFPQTKIGLCNVLLRSQIQKALDNLKTTSPCMMVNSTNEVIIDPYNKGYTVVDKPPLFLHPESVGDKAVTTYMGTVLKDGLELTSNARPPYIPTPFEGIEDEFGPSKHRPPKNPNSTEKAILTLNKLVSPVQHYEGNILIKAIDDYKNQTLDIIRENREEVTSMLRIYTQEEALNGTNDGVLSGIPNATSAGFGLDKSKMKCLKRDPFDESLPLIPREFNEEHQQIQDEIDYTLRCWSEEKRSECIYKASSKVNELLPNKKAHEKVRKFYGGQFANLVASRRAIGGVPLFMQEYWQRTECMVGINPMSKQWNDFHKHLTKFGDDRMIAGDFASFDTTMAAQITTAAAKIILSWYEEVGCSKDELKMVKGALSDIVNPNIIFEGQLYRFANGNPSGNLITVQLNSICNSLMMRYVYYSIFPGVAESFNTNVVLGTYGDDNAMGVRKHCTWFNHTACQEAFAKVGIKYTMAEKDAKSVPYITINDISFLKRSFVYHKDLQTIVAPIEEDSTLKRFYYIKKPSECPLSFEEQFGCYTDGAFRDMYLKGREAYNAFSDKIMRIVQRNPSLVGYVEAISYDNMTNILKPDYSEQYIPRNKKLFTESMGCYSDISSLTFDDDIIIENHTCFVEELLSKRAAIKAGAENIINFTRQKYVDRLTWLKTVYRFDFTRYRFNFSRISTMLEDLLLDNSNGYIRKQPYCIIISGLPGSGKTGFAIKIAAKYMKALYGSFRAEDLVTLNETDDFQSEYRSHHKVVIFDDIAAERNKSNTKNPWRKILDFVNNIRKTALNPNVELKGNVYIQPDLVILTTNRLPYYGISEHMMCVSALLRRFNAEVYLCSEGEGKAKPYKHLIIRKKHSKEFEDSRADQVAAHGLDSNAYAFYRDSKELVDRDEYMESTIPDFIIHHQKQQVFVDEINSVFPPEVNRKSFHQAFYDDVIYPIWPKTQELPKEIYSLISWKEKFIRLFCVYDKNKMAFAQGSYSNPASSHLIHFCLSMLIAFGVNWLFLKHKDSKVSMIPKTINKKMTKFKIQKHRAPKGVGFCSPDLDLGPYHIIVKDAPSVLERDCQTHAIKAYMEQFPDHTLVGREVDLSKGGRIITSLDLLFLDRSQSILTIVEVKHKGITAAQLQSVHRYHLLKDKVPYEVRAWHFTSTQGLLQSR